MLGRQTVKEESLSKIKYLKYFQAVVDYGSVDQAARIMYISQSHPSHIIKKAEEEVGLELFQRTKQDCVLTKNGKKCLKHCEVTLREIGNLKQFSSEIQAGKSVTSISTTKFSHMAECFNRVCCRYWDLENHSYRPNEDSMMNVIDDVIGGSANMRVIHFASQEPNIVQKLFSDRELEFRPLTTFLSYVRLSNDHELLNGSSGIDTSELRNYGFVRYVGQFEDSIYHATAENLHLDLNDSSRIVYVSDRAEQMNPIPTGGFFIIGTSEFSGQSSLYGVVSVPLMNCSEHILFRIATERNGELSGMEQEFIDEMTESYRQLQMRGNQAVRSGLTAD